MFVSQIVHDLLKMICAAIFKNQFLKAEVFLLMLLRSFIEDKNHKLVSRIDKIKILSVIENRFNVYYYEWIQLQGINLKKIEKGNILIDNCSNAVKIQSILEIIREYITGKTYALKSLEIEYKIKKYQTIITNKIEII